MNYILCPKCHIRKTNAGSQCSNCDYSFSEIELLRSEIFQIKGNFNEKIDQLERKLSQLEMNAIEKPVEIKQEEKKVESIIHAQQKQEIAFVQKKEVQATEVINPVQEQKVQRKSGLIERLFEYLLEILFGYFSGLGEFVQKIYQKYKNENKLPIFFMTLSGIIIFLLGFGYLFQYSFSNYFNEMAKVASGFVTASIILFIAIRLFKRYPEFSSALMALSIILNYVTIYFLSTYFGLASSLTGFILIIVNAYLSMYLALKFETKTIAALFLYGSALTPFYLASNSDPLFYYIFLFIILLSAIYVANKIKWKSLIFSSLFLVYGILELSFFSSTTSPTVINAITILTFMYLYIIYSLSEKLKIKTVLDNYDLSTIVISITISSLSLYNIVSNLNILGMIYILCSLPFLVISLLKKKMPNKNIHLVFFLIFTVFLIFAIPALVDIKLVGILWSVEALFLIVCAFVFDLSKLRKNAYSVLIFSLLSISYTLPFLILDWDYGLQQAPFYNLVFIYLIALFLYFILKRFHNVLEKYELTLFDILKDFLPNYFSIVLILISIQLFGLFGFVFIPVIVLSLLYWSKLKSLEITRYSSIIFYLLLLIPILFSIEDADSYRFSQQTLYGKISILEMFSMLWFLEFFIQKLGISDKIEKITKGFRELFYLLIPFTIITLTRKFDIEYLIITGWLSIVITYFLYQKFKFKSLKIEFYTILFFFNAVIFISVFFHNSSSIFQLEYISLVIGFFLTLIFLLQNKRDKNNFLTDPLNKVLSYSYYYILATLFLTIHMFFSLSLAFMVSAIYLLYLVRFYKYLTPIRHLYSINYIYSKISFIVAILLSSYSDFIAINTICLFFYLIEWYRLLHSSKIIHLGLPPKLKRRNQTYWRMDQYIFHFFFIVVTLLTIEQLLIETAYVTSFLIVYAILVLYKSTKRNYEFVSKFAYSVFSIAFLKLFVYDLEGFELITKIIVFMLLGTLLLGSAYLFQRLRKNG
jgi:hypothetical protein